MEIVTIMDVEHLALKLAREKLSFSEPIPDFSTRYPNILESCLAAPFQMFGGKYLYPSLRAKAGNLFYLMIKNHPFQNGNKRIAMTSLMTFLFLNKKWLRVDTQEFYNFALWVTESPPKFKSDVVSAIEKFLNEYMVDL